MCQKFKILQFLFAFIVCSMPVVDICVHGISLLLDYIVWVGLFLSVSCLFFVTVRR